MTYSLMAGLIVGIPLIALIMYLDMQEGKAEKDKADKWHTL